MSSSDSARVLSELTSLEEETRQGKHLLRAIVLKERCKHKLSVSHTVLFGVFLFSF